MFLESLSDSNRSISSSPTATNLSLDAIFVVCWIKGSNYNWKHMRLMWEFPWTLLWDLTISGWPNEWINITLQCFIKSDSRYLYVYIISLTLSIVDPTLHYRYRFGQHKCACYKLCEHNNTQSSRNKNSRLEKFMHKNVVHYIKMFNL